MSLTVCACEVSVGAANAYAGKLSVFPTNMTKLKVEIASMRRYFDCVIISSTFNPTQLDNR